MGTAYRKIFPNISERIQKECVRSVEISEREMIGLPYPYTVSIIGKSDLMSCWPIYFINLGLIRLKLVELAKHNAGNLIFLPQKYNFIPNSNHKNDLKKPAMPYLALIVRDVYRATGNKDWLGRIFPVVKNEFKYWFAKPRLSQHGLVTMVSNPNQDTADPKFKKLTEFWSQSPRWHQSDLCIPVDLNALLYHDAMILEDLAKEIRDDDATFFAEKAEQIKDAMELSWDQETGFYYDYDLGNEKLLNVKSLAAFQPMFAKMIPMRRAEQLVDHLEDFAHKSGITCLDQDYGIKNMTWNYPNSFAPLIWIVVKGLINYDFIDEARELALRWLDLTFRLYQETGEFWERYNVVEGSVLSDNPPNNNLPIMGWTAGVYVELVETFGLE